MTRNTYENHDMQLATHINRARTTYEARSVQLVDSFPRIQLKSCTCTSKLLSMFTPMGISFQFLIPDISSAFLPIPNSAIFHSSSQSVHHSINISFSPSLPDALHALLLQYVRFSVHLLLRSIKQHQYQQPAWPSLLMVLD